MHIKLCKKYLHHQYVEKHLESFILVLDRNCFGWNAALVRHRQAQQTDRQRDLDWPQRWVWQQLLLTTPLIFTTVYHHQRYYSTTTKLWIHTQHTDNTIDVNYPVWADWKFDWKILEVSCRRKRRWDQLVAGSWAGRVFSPVPELPLPWISFSLVEQEGVERLASSTLQCHLSLVLV